MSLIKQYNKLKSDLIESIRPYSGKKYCDKLNKDKSYIINSIKNGSIDRLIKIYKDLNLQENK